MSRTRFRILPYSPFSNSARLLAERLGGKRIKLEGSRYQYRESDIIINWGNSNPPIRPSQMLNFNTSIVTSKLAFFRWFEGQEYLPQFWTNPEEIPDDAFPIVCRTVLNGHSGHGIVLSNGRDDLVPCQLYVKYIPKKDEYRVHIGLNRDNQPQIIAIQQKKRKLEHENPDWKIRNHANGFVYAREGVDPPAGVLDVSHSCLLHSGLDFGAFDVIWNEQQQKAYVLEVNTAPGLEGQTLDDYVNYFRGFV